MNAAERRRFLFRAVLAGWGMLTVALLGCIGLLVTEMLRQKQDPLALAKEMAAPPPQPAGKTIEQPAAASEISLFFADAAARGLVPETGVIEMSEFTTENSRNAIEALIQGPKTGLAPILPPAAKLRGLYLLEEGELVVDFSMELEFEVKKIQSAALEILMFQGITHTLTQPGIQGRKQPPVKKVRFLIEGATPYESFPGHIDVAEPLVPDPQWAAHSNAARPADATAPDPG